MPDEIALAGYCINGRIDFGAIDKHSDWVKCASGIVGARGREQQFFNISIRDVECPAEVVRRAKLRQTCNDVGWATACAEFGGANWPFAVIKTIGKPVGRRRIRAIVPSRAKWDQRRPIGSVGRGDLPEKTLSM
jgi:hypothetical protein